METPVNSSWPGNSAAVVTLGNTPNTDILCSNQAGTRFVHIQVKTFVPGGKTCSVGVKAERHFGPKFFWVLAGIPHPPSRSFECFVIPSAVMARNLRKFHKRWLATPGKSGQPHKDSKVRTVHLPPNVKWNIEKYRERWDLIAEQLAERR